MNSLEEKLMPIAKKWAGNIPIWEVRKIGIDPSAIRHWAQNNPNVVHMARGVYTWIDPDKDFDWVNTETARQIAQGGENAYLWGPSVLELMEIGEIGSPLTYVAVPTRRRAQPRMRWITQDGSETDLYAGLPIQNLEDAVQATMLMVDEKKQCSILDAVENRYPEKKQFIEKLSEEYGYSER